MQSFGCANLFLRKMGRGLLDFYFAVDFAVDFAQILRRFFCADFTQILRADLKSNYPAAFGGKNIYNFPVYWQLVFGHCHSSVLANPGQHASWLPGKCLNPNSQWSRH
jgi:hypothetical protein